MTDPVRPPEEVRWLGHATCVIDVAGVRIVTDPLVGARAGALIRRGHVPPQETWSGAEAVLLSHLHHDHAHLPSLRAVGGTVLGPPATSLWALRQRLRGRAITDDWYDLTGDEGGAAFGVVGNRGRTVRIRTVPAVHGDRPMPHRPNAAVGFVVRWEDDDGETRRLWFAGDTELFDGLAQVPELAGGAIDMALVPVGGWGPRLSGGHLNPERAAQACALVGARAAIPIHWGTFYAPLGRHVPRGWMDRGGPEFVEAVGEVSPGTRAVLLSPGDATPLRRAGV